MPNVQEITRTTFCQHLCKVFWPKLNNYEQSHVTSCLSSISSNFGAQLESKHFCVQLMRFKLAIFLYNVSPTENRLQPRWWSGGVAGAINLCFNAPLDLIESRMMAHTKYIHMTSEFKRTIKKDGFFSLYDGFSAQILRQLTYTSMRFHLYETGKQYMNERAFLDKVFVASMAGLLCGIVGIPTDLINTRMQVDRILPKKYRRRYKNVFHGLYMVCHSEGFGALYTGWQYACMRAVGMTIGQNVFYDQAKDAYMSKFSFEHHSKSLHFISSVTAALACLPIVHPLEVLKTVAMSMRTGNIRNTDDEVKFMLRFGLRGLFRGIVPGLLRLVPNTVILFLVYEQLRLNFGYYDNKNEFELPE